MTKHPYFFWIVLSLLNGNPEIWIPTLSIIWILFCFKKAPDIIDRILIGIEP